MCNYELLAVDEGVTDDDVLEQAEVAIAKLGGDLSRYPYLLLTSQGSFFDDEEVNPELRNQLLRKFWDAGLRAISTESEARYCLDESRLTAVKQCFPGRISVGIGMEAADDFVRNSIINKGLPIRMLEAATATLKTHGIGFYTYVSLGKPFLTPEEDVADAVSAVLLSRRLGAFMSVLEMINIQPHTLTERLWQRSLYSTCSLWLGVEVLSRLTETERETTSVKGFDADVEPVPLALPHSCTKCDARLRAALNEWNLRRDYHALETSAGTCDCAPVLGPSFATLEALEDRVSRGLAVLAQ